MAGTTGDVQVRQRWEKGQHVANEADAAKCSAQRKVFDLAITRHARRNDGAQVRRIFQAQKKRAELRLECELHRRPQPNAAMSVGAWTAECGEDRANPYKEARQDAAGAPPITGQRAYWRSVWSMSSEAYGPRSAQTGSEQIDTTVVVQIYVRPKRGFAFHDGKPSFARPSYIAQSIKITFRGGVERQDGVFKNSANNFDWSGLHYKSEKPLEAVGERSQVGFWDISLNDARANELTGTEKTGLSRRLD
ncbi:hypothetical protein C8R43DRAFT_942143 [Mycena crocata]|nr:hypothetical protein C8R43DRAFT_942143 [Mycena crocata]